jgi:hypothetical protein
MMILLLFSIRGDFVAKKLCPLCYFLGISSWGLSIIQHKYVVDLLRYVGMLKC